MWTQYPRVKHVFTAAFALLDDEFSLAECFLVPLNGARAFKV
jgi:hypothetical protein